MTPMLKVKIENYKKNWNLVLHLSWTEIKVRYARSAIGPFWLVLTTAISVLGLSYIWSILFNMDKEVFIPSLTVGLVIWQFLAACINEAPNCFAVYSSTIRNYTHPVWIYPTALVIKNFIIFLHNLVILVVVLVIYPPDFGWATAMIFPALLLILLVLTQITTILAFLGARYKDLGAAIIAFMSIVFFLSPVIFIPNQLGVKEYLMWFNPFSYLITIIRDPLIGHVSGGFVYLVTIIFMFIAAALMHFLLMRYRYRVLYWI
ncbi:ABC transporter permease [Yersinia frederiksenii]|uniref:ABC transporter permease n=1 Tax=Yersinia frederiksenii TaxID=29484 RepID=UPI0005EA32B0|nr:ABC transporter permease [Yersinia frederiksenii]CFR05148.1 ABC-2 [Yersinia frederiksenii]